ncbi:MAG: hypothetical protein EHM33_20165 [Chloroflexi bacterium]|nr:MAG: hypothetical protein EHM33_20165 [Chloroflexota bacterium]
MKKEFLPYYISRFILSIVISILVWHFTWMAALLTFVFFGLFLLYLHSGWFSIDLSTPLYPLRLDSHGREVQRKALIFAVTLSLLLYTFAVPLSNFIGIPLISGHTARSVGIITYFLTQFTLYIKTSMQAHLSSQ